MYCALASDGSDVDVMRHLLLHSYFCELCGRVQILGAVNIGWIYCQNCAPGGRAQWVLDESLRRIEDLLNLTSPTAFFEPMVASGHLHEVPDPGPLVGAKRMLFDQGQIDDALETSVWQRHSRRRTVAAILPAEQAKGVMHYHGWNGTGLDVAGPAWGREDEGLVWDHLSYPAGARNETVRSAVGPHDACLYRVS